MKHAKDNDLISHKSTPKNKILTDEQKQYIKTNFKARDPEYGYSALARKFNVSFETIRRNHLKY